MEKISEEKLSVQISEDFLDFEDTSNIQIIKGIIGQKEALSAIETGLGIKSKGFNIFVVGKSGTGRTSAVKSYVERIAKESETPPDICFANNFNDSYTPIAIMLPPGKAKEFNKKIKKIIKRIDKELYTLFERDSFRERQNTIRRKANEVKDKIIEEREAQIAALGFIVKKTDKGIFPIPVRNGKELSEEEFIKLSDKEKAEIIKNRNIANDIIESILRDLGKIDFEFTEEENELMEKTVKDFVNHLFEDIEKEFSEYKKIPTLLKKMKDSIVENYKIFNPQIQKEGLEIKEDFLQRFYLNIVVDNSQIKGAPVITEENPLYKNLIGRIERESVMGNLVTDFSLIIAGSLLKANGGYLIIDAEELLSQPLSYRALKRSLQTGFLQIEDIESTVGITTTKSLRPEPVPLSLKVILIGDPSTYYELLFLDKEFLEIFKIKAEFDLTMEMNKKNADDFISFVSMIVKKDKLNEVNRDGIKALLRYASRVAGEKEKLTTNFGLISSIIKEADFYSKQEGKIKIDSEDIQKAIIKREDRVSLIKTKQLELIKKNKFFISTEGKKVGIINGLTVINPGDIEFGVPVRISASVGMGKDGIINIEREAELSGAIHTKGVLILSGYICDKFGKEMPLNFSTKLVFEQTYSEIDGDSASAAELIAILSALSEIPIKQSYAITGSINQRGEIQPIGGVNEKIEGFFEILKHRGFKEKGGVLIPSTNVSDLNLKEEVIEAVKSKKFEIIAIDKVEEALSFFLEKDIDIIFKTIKEKLEYFNHNIDGK